MMDPREPVHLTGGCCHRFCLGKVSQRVVEAVSEAHGFSQTQLGQNATGLVGGHF